MISFLLLGIDKARGMIGEQRAMSPVVRGIEVQYPADFSNDAYLVGASHNVFVARVLAQTGEERRGLGPETQYRVEVLLNIKGDLRGEVTLNQVGGLEGNVLYMAGEGSSSDYLLKPGFVYVFATRYNADRNWHTLNTYPTARKLISEGGSLPNATLIDIARQDERVQALHAAYPREILLKADIAQNNIPNSYENTP